MALHIYLLVGKFHEAFKAAAASAAAAVPESEVLPIWNA